MRMPPDGIARISLAKPEGGRNACGTGSIVAAVWCKEPKQQTPPIDEANA
jgi:hypothetical protein